MSRPAKIVAPIAPEFHEVERNIWYVEREDEFENKITDQNERKRLSDWEAKEAKKGLVNLDERQQK